MQNINALAGAYRAEYPVDNPNPDDKNRNAGNGPPPSPSPSPPGNKLYPHHRARQQELVNNARLQENDSVASKLLAEQRDSTIGHALERFRHVLARPREQRETIKPDNPCYDLHADVFGKLTPAEQAELLPHLDVQWRRGILQHLSASVRAGLVNANKENLYAFINGTEAELSIASSGTRFPDPAFSRAPQNREISLLSVSSSDLSERWKEIGRWLMQQEYIRPHRDNPDWHLFHGILNEEPIRLYLEFSPNADVANVIQPSRFDELIQQLQHLEAFYARWRRNGQIREIAGSNMSLNGRLYLDPDDPDEAMKALAIAESKSHFTAAQLGEEIGRGCEKSVHLLKTEPDLVIAKFLPEWEGTEDTNNSSLDMQVRLLNQLGDVGYPVLRNHGIVSVEGTQAILMDRVVEPECSTDLIAKYDKNSDTVPISRNINEKTIEVLSALRQKLIDDGLYIQDLQFLFDKNKNLYLTDPQAVIPADDRERDDLEIINKLIVIGEKSKLGRKHASLNVTPDLTVFSDQANRG